MKTSRLKVGKKSKGKIKGKKTIVEISKLQRKVIKLSITNIFNFSVFNLKVFDQVPKIETLHNFSQKPKIINSKKYYTLIWEIESLRINETYSIYYEISLSSIKNEKSIDDLIDKGLVC